MKITILLILISSLTFAQSVYQVEPGMKGNKIILTIENSSTSLSIEELKITERNNSKFIEMKVDEYRITNIEQSSEKEIEIEFDILSEAPINEKDSLLFNITDSKGESWSKEIILEYTPPKEYALFQNYPNPFNPSTTIKYSIPSNGKREMSNTKLIVYDILGREVATLINEKQKPGNYEVVFNAQNLASGTYFYRLTSGDFVKTMKFVLIK
jgi:hypothetical protein